ncbi:phosphoribosyltransferase family protein [Streptomyces sp. NBC_01716]|uniref:phosphoribosyltransferase family protein n=1 Tax=Streptomyces sp. NBC_01716 TaxID=2975917 RepID=UPI002E342069|nr:phosphoribosyltransferase family protein [Streptomyces sp. NBC_01716]
MPVSARDLTLEHFRWISGHADVWAVFRDARALAAVVTGLVEPFRGEGITAVCGIEARGFLLGGAAAVELGVGFVPVRKGEGLFPGDKVARQSSPDYRGLCHTLRLQRSSLGPGDRVVLVDDWIETGSQAAAVRSMVEECGSVWVGCSVIVDQLPGAPQYPLGTVRGIVTAQDLPSPLRRENPDHSDRGV